jgi:hypothetical protein
MRLRFLVLLPGLWLFTAPIRGADEVSPVARAYIDAAFNVMEEHFLHHERIDWRQLRRETLLQAGGAQTPVDTYPALRFALSKLGDRHSYLQLTPELTREEKSRQPKLMDPSAMAAAPVRKPSFPFPSPFRSRRLPEGAMVAGAAAPLAHIAIPFFYSQEQAAINDYATVIQNLIAELAAEKPCGWIVDLRGNGGGNMWVMLAGVGPILGDGEPGANLHRDGPRKWFYESGAAGYRDDKKDPYYARTTGTAVSLPRLPAAALLIDRDTGSSGEAIAIAFRGRANTRFFGESTYALRRQRIRSGSPMEHNCSL